MSISHAMPIILLGTERAWRSLFLKPQPQHGSPVKIWAEPIRFRLMQAIEATGTIDAQGQLALDQPLQVAHPGRVRIIVLLTEASNQLPEQTQPNAADREPMRENHLPDTRPIWERVADISAQVPPEEWAKLPKDLSKNVDHYLYGAPKEDE